MALVGSSNSEKQKKTSSEKWLKKKNSDKPISESKPVGSKMIADKSLSLQPDQLIPMDEKEF